MSTRKLKRPSSARRNIRFECFSQYVSATRLRHVQSLLREAGDSKSQAPDAILSISGIDARYNDGSQEFINYLLFGFFDVRKNELEKSGFDEEVIDDMIILVRKKSVDVYCNPINYCYLLPYLSHWYNINFHCMTDSQYEDEEAAEDFKMSSFVNMVKNCPRIGIPYSSSVHIHPFDKFAVEKWPIVQSYALEGVGGGGFFTMLHEVSDMSSPVHELYNKMDPVALELLLTEHLPLLERQWNNMTSTVDIEITNHAGDIEEERLFEPLRSYFQHGSVLTGAEKSDRKLPFVLFGHHSSKAELHETQNVEVFKSKKRLGSHKGQTTLSLLCQAVDPKGPLTCARTYFFTPMYEPFSDDSDARNITDVSYLQCVYKAVVEAVMTGIQTYANTLSVTQARLKAVQTLHDSCGDMKTTAILDYLSDKSRVTFTIEAVDYQARPSQLQDGCRNLMVKLATMTLNDIPGCNNKDQKLGSIIFAESFLESAIPVEDKGAAESIDSEVLVLTSHIPRVQMWTCDDQQKKKTLEEKLHDHTLGEVLMDGEGVQLTTGAAYNTPPSQVTLYLYEKGLVANTHQYGAFSLLPKHITSSSYYDGESISNVALLILLLTESGLHQLPPHLQATHSQLVIILPPRSKARKALFQEVLPRWKEDRCEMRSVERLDTLSSDYQEMYKLLQIQHSVPVGVISPANTMTFKRVPSVLPKLHRFLKHFTASSAGWSKMSRSDLSCLLNHELPPQTDDNTDWIPVSIISGVPGCHKENLVRTITSMDKEDTRWTTICQPHDNNSIFDPISLQNSLTSAFSANRRRHTSGTYKRTRVVILTPGYTDIMDVVHAVVNHPQSEVAAQIRIGAITACIDPYNTFMEQRLTFPSLLNHCAQGWVNCILFTSTKGELLDEVQTLVRSINTDVALLLADKAVVHRSPDLELIMSETSFHQPKMIAARHLLHPGWQHGLYLNSPTIPPLNRVVLKFSKPLNKNKFFNHLRGLRGNLSSPSMEGNIYHVEGSVKFTDSRQVISIQYVSLSNYLTSTPSDDQTVPPSRAMNGEALHESYLTFSGCCLQEHSLKHWLRACAEQKPEKKKLVERKDLKREDVAKIHKEHHLESLPEGWFYNGTQFISMSGDKSDTHPNLDEFVQTWIQEHNTEVTAYNTKIEAEAFTDLFD